MKLTKLFFLLVLYLGIASCASPPKPSPIIARLYTIDNQEIVLRDMKAFEKDYFVESEVFRPRWRQSLEQVPLPFSTIASAQKVSKDITEVQFRNGDEDEFTEFFVDEYNLRGWSDYGPFEINASLVRGLVFLDEEGRPVTGRETEIPPVIPPAEYADRFITFDGDIISGDILEEAFKLRAAYGTLNIAKELIAVIIIDREGPVLKQIVELVNGDIISGFVEPARIRMQVSDEQVVTMDVEQLSRILFTRPLAVEEVE